MRITGSVVIHQPHFLPWPPFIAKLALSDIFVVQDNVQYRKGYFQNRTRIMDERGEPKWLTLPVHAHSQSLLSETSLDHSNGRLIRHVRHALQNSYCHARSYHSLWPCIDIFLRGLESPEDQRMLASVNVASILLLMTALNIEPPRVVYASSLHLQGQSRTDRLLEILQFLGGRHYLVGWGASAAVHDLSVLAREGIDTLALDRSRATAICPDFTATNGLSTVHWMMISDPSFTADRIRSYRQAVHHLEVA